MECWEDLSTAGDGSLGLSPRISDTDLCRIVPDDIRVILPWGDWPTENEAELGTLRGVRALFQDIGLSIALLVSLDCTLDEITL
jgi:hypothetical protein